jgi:hypothetical protein
METEALQSARQDELGVVTSMRSRDVPTAGLPSWLRGNDHDGVTRRVLVLLSIGSILVACGDGQPLGYGGPPIANAVRADARPVLVSTGEAGTRARPYVYTQVHVENISAVPLRVHRCTATTRDNDGNLLSLTGVFDPDAFLPPGAWMRSMGTACWGGDACSSRAYSLDAVLAVTRYSVSCEVFIWAGPPPYGGDRLTDDESS